ncbi:hypothetical protein AVEN_49019-1 [Araneus ventricosus]|uniref:ATP-dependent DNA helicase n=1 Tax=Araneus ventricosus TaxID=182803 RepID=A0A4Y2AH03_ARAVE|nr:hypothetical protein AVEN_49019-1 [Araneus ventricosus]
MLRNKINRCYTRNVVKVCALTGVAARLIGGSAIHSLLKLPVQKDGRSAGISLLTGNYLRIMRQQWKEIEFIILVMVSYQMLCMVDSRLRQLKNTENEFFGGINVLGMTNI